MTILTIHIFLASFCHPDSPGQLATGLIPIV
jgi:hypothetical protein